jgi:hypothetical protein
LVEKVNAAKVGDIGVIFLKIWHTARTPIAQQMNPMTGLIEALSIGDEAIFAMSIQKKHFEV